MARTWLSITVELLGGKGEDLWPTPGRTFAVGPAHTFMDFADAINTAFARWDMAHLSEFTLPDGTTVAYPEFALEFMEGGFGPVSRLLDIDRAKVAAHVKLGDEFRFVFDLGDDWVHHCTAHQFKIDPVDTLGIRPKTPLPYWGWGDLPDQYGRRWTDDDGESEPAPRPDQPHPMRDGRWPEPAGITRADLVAVRRALADRDPDAFLSAITGRDIDDALQQISSGAALLLQVDDDQMTAVAVSFINRLSMRGLPGDEVLSEDLVARLRGEPLPGREAPVDVGRLSTMLDDPEHPTGAYVDLGADPDRYLWLDRFDTRDRLGDSVAFAARQRDRDLRRRLEAALDGGGAFRAFRAAVDETGLTEKWLVFSADMELGRTRARLADHDIRVALP